MDVSQLSINTAVTLAEVYRYADTIFRASPPEAASRRQRKNPQMDVPLYQKYAGASQGNPPEAAALRAGGFLCLSASMHGGRPRMGAGQGGRIPKSGGFF